MNCEIASPSLVFAPLVKLSLPMIGLLFVHGFLGSQQSFLDFPVVLGEAIRQNFTEIEVLHYEYDTKGNYQRQTQKLMDFLLSKCHTVKYSKVILLAHSMGGLLCADAFRYLYQLELQPEKKSWLGSFFSYTKPILASSDDIRLLLNIVGIVTFDSPFYGLSSNIVGTSLRKIPGLMPDFVRVPTMHELIPDQLPLPIKGIEVPVSIEWIKEKVKVFEMSSNSTVDIHSTMPLQNDTNGTAQNYTRSAIAIGAIGALAQSSLATPIASAHAIQQIENVSHYGFFLDPLTHSYAHSHERILILIKHLDFFKGFYNTSMGNSTFCVLPPDNVSSAFHSLQTEGNVLDAHMNMFDPHKVGTSPFSEAISICVDLIKPHL
jgi:hypothetical protein